MIKGETVMEAFLNDAALKGRMVAAMRAHSEADALIKGQYGDEGSGGSFKGCAVGCALESLNGVNGTNHDLSDHSRFPTELGIPKQLAHLLDAIFENLPTGEGPDFAVAFLESIPVGVDLVPVVNAFMVWLMKRTYEVVEGLDIDASLKSQVLAAITLTASFLESGKADVGSDAAYAARIAAAAEARDAAYAARNAAAAEARDAAYAARAAAEARAAAVTDATDAAARAARAARAADAARYAGADVAAYAARAHAYAARGDAAAYPAAAADAAGAAAWENMASKLLELLPNTKTEQGRNTK